MNKIFVSEKGNELPEEVTKLIGKSIYYRTGDKREEGICIGAEKVPQEIMNMETKKRRKGVRYLFKPNGSSRAKWTKAFPYGPEY